jgi:hypothetical protein
MLLRAAGEAGAFSEVVRAVGEGGGGGNLGRGRGPPQRGRLGGPIGKDPDFRIADDPPGTRKTDYTGPQQPHWRRTKAVCAIDQSRGAHATTLRVKRDGATGG